MLTTKELKGLKVCQAAKPGKEYTKDGVPRHRRKIGKVFKTVFNPGGDHVVGFIVQRPDLLWMFKRPDRFLALDSMDIQDGCIVPIRGMDSWDERAIKRLGVDYDTCIIWEEIQVKTREGVELGAVDDMSFDENTGELQTLFLDDGGASRALLGSIEVPSGYMIGYEKGFLIVESDALECKAAGGLAAKAGVATAKVGMEAKEGVAKAGAAVGKAASTAVDKGSVGLGKLVGRAKDSVTGAVSEYRKESGAPKKSTSDGAKAASSSKKASSSSKKGASGTKASSGTAKAATGTSKAATGAKASATTTTTTTAKKASSASSAKKATTAKTATKSTGKAVGDHLKSAGSMFSDFKKEYDKASKK